MTDAEFGRIWTYLLAAYPRQQVHERTIRVYHDALKSYAPRQLSAAAKRHVQQSMWFPSVAELHALVARVRVCVRCGSRRATRWIDSGQGLICGVCELPALAPGERVGSTEIAEVVRGVLARLGVKP